MQKILKKLGQVLFGVFVLGKLGYGINLTLSPYFGLMQQPASHYYHGIYGLNIQSNIIEKMYVRIGYFERPEFESQTYTDKDYGFYGLFGIDVTRTKIQGLRAFSGIGRNKGYIVQIVEGDREERFYTLKGLSFVMEYFLEVGQLDMGMSHMLFIGSNNNEHLKALVAWPFSFFTMSIGYKWG